MSSIFPDANIGGQELASNGSACRGIRIACLIEEVNVSKDEEDMSQIEEHVLQNEEKG